MQKNLRKKLNKQTSNWFVYIILSTDDSLYTGITTDVDRRFAEHLNKKGAKYFYGRTPLKIVYKKQMKNRSEASKEECRIKSLTKKQKLEFLNNL